MITALAEAAKAIPAYCSSGKGVHTPQQWAYCAKLGWQQPTTNAASSGYSVGYHAVPVLGILIVIALVLWGLSRLGSRRSAPASN